MELFRNLRIRAGKSMLSGKISKLTRKPHYINFFNIKNIGVVWDASRPEEFSLLTKFYQRMSEQKIDVTILGYYPGKKLPDQYTAIRFLTCIKNNEVDFLYRPVTSETDKFIKNRFDVLIDLNFRNLFPLVYVSSLSVASLKVGLSDSRPESSPFDLMISLKNTVSIDEYLEQVILYLEMINSETVKKAV
jgi:hypothetical protein